MFEYVSIAEVLMSIFDTTEEDARQQLGDLEQDMRLSEMPQIYPLPSGELSSFGILGKGAYLNLYSAKFRKSWSARMLEEKLNNARYRGGCPALYEFALTGRARLDPNSWDVARIALVAIAKEYDQALAAHLSGASTPLNLLSIKVEGSEHIPALKLLGFERVEIISFLGQQGIPHSFNEIQNNAVVGNVADRGSLCNQKAESIHSSKEYSESENNLSSNLPTLSKPQIHRIAARRSNTVSDLQRNLYLDVMEEFSGEDPNPSIIAQEVWLRLLEIAKRPDDERPVFLKHYKQGNRIESDGEGFTGFTRKSLRQNILRWLNERHLNRFSQ